MTLPVLPQASTLTTPQQVADLAAVLVAWAETVDDIAEVREASAKWAAITEYVRRTSREGVAEAEGALRRLEVRVGQLLGEAQAGRPTAETSVATDITRDARHDFRQMAAHPEIVEQVIASSTDTDPPSRAKVLREIKTQSFNDLVAQDVAKSKAWVESSGYDFTDDRRRGRIFAAITAACEALDEMVKVATVEDIVWTLESTPPFVAHVADFARDELARIFTNVNRYRELEQP